MHWILFYAWRTLQFQKVQFHTVFKISFNVTKVKAPSSLTSVGIQNSNLELLDYYKKFWSDQSLEDECFALRNTMNQKDMVVSNFWDLMWFSYLAFPWHPRAEFKWDYNPGLSLNGLGSMSRRGGWRLQMKLISAAEGYQYLQYPETFWNYQ